jgi:hypothetical protein
LILTHYRQQVFSNKTTISLAIPQGKLRVACMRQLVFACQLALSRLGG